MASTVAGMACRSREIVIIAAAATYTIASAPRVLHLLNPGRGGHDCRRRAGMAGRRRTIRDRRRPVRDDGFADLRVAAVRAAGYAAAHWMDGRRHRPGRHRICAQCCAVGSRAHPAMLEPIYDRALLATLFLSLSVPLAFAYAVARHELFGVRLVIRMSIQYALARTALLWMLAIPVIGLMWTIWRQPDLTVRGLLSAGTPHLYLLIVIALSLACESGCLRAIDRRFFRDARDRERILLDLASEIGRTETVEEPSRWPSMRSTRHFIRARPGSGCTTRADVAGRSARRPNADAASARGRRGDSIRSCGHRHRRADPQSRPPAHRHHVARPEAFRGACTAQAIDSCCAPWPCRSRWPSRTPRSAGRSATSGGSGTRS